jgi:hypothetical protein
MLTGGRADSSSRFQNFNGVFKPRNFWLWLAAVEEILDFKEVLEDW